MSKRTVIPNYSSSIPHAALLYSREFIQGAGVVIFHRSTKRVVLVIDNDYAQYGYFLPKGRKNVGEKIEDTAVREGEEESGYKNSLLPVPIEHHCPPNPDLPQDTKEAIYDLSTEPIYMYLQEMPKKKRWPYGGTYLCHWFVSEVSDEEVARVEKRKASDLTPSEAYQQESRLQALVDSGSLQALVQSGKPVDELADALAGLDVKDSAKRKEEEARRQIVDQHELGYESVLVDYGEARYKLRRNDTLRMILEMAIQRVEMLDEIDRQEGAAQSMDE